jgi:RNA polymerase sigma-70 factor (ECF subfamily)
MGKSEFYDIEYFDIRKRQESGEKNMDRARRAGKDRELSRALSENVDGNFERLVRVFQDRLYSFSLRLANNRADAEEIVQDGFVRAYRALKAYPPQRIELMDLSPWLYRIVLNVFRTRFRKAQCRPFSPGGVTPATGGAGEIASGPNPQEMVEEAEGRKQLEKAVASLPERYRVPLVLRYIENIAYAGIKDILKQPEGTVKANVHRGVQLLRENFSKMNRREKQ